MSCDNENIEYWRLVQKYSTISGLEPTIPPSQDHNDGTWSDTDLYIGELFINTSDNKIWMRTEDGIHQISGTGGTGSFVGDYVPTSGGTFSGPIFSPTMSANGMIAYVISASAFNGLQFGSSQSVYYGDGSNLTGITTTWNGGTVSNPSSFGQEVLFGSDVILDGQVSSNNGYIDIQSDLLVNGGVSASYYYGDGSNLTGIVASSSNYYTEDVYLTGSTLVFDRNDTPNAYSINLDPILGTNSIQVTYWDPITNQLSIITNGGDTFTTTINEFSSLSATGDITANTFYGSFVGTFSGDVYTSDATLFGTELVFDRTNGSSYSVDLSSISGTGSGGGSSSQTLGQTLGYGNETLGHDIHITNGDSIQSDDGERTITMQSPKVFIQNEFLNTVEGIPVLQYGVLDINRGGTLTELKNYTEDISTGEQRSASVQVTDRLAVIGAGNQVSSNTAYVKVESGSGMFPQAEVRLDTVDGFGNSSYLEMHPGYMELGGVNNDGFVGLQYADDYSLDYSNRSLVDKEYVTNAVSGSTLPLEQVLKNGNTTGTQSIYISSSQSQIVGHNGIYQKWTGTSSTFPFNSNFKISNGTQSETKITIDGQNTIDPDSVRIMLENGSMASTGQISRTTILPDSVRNYVSDTDDTTYSRYSDLSSTSYQNLIETRWTDFGTTQTNDAFIRTDLYDPYNPNIYLQTTKNDATEGGYIKIEAGEINIHLEDQPQFLFSNTSFRRDQNIIQNYYTQTIPYVGSFYRSSRQETSVWQDAPDYARQISSSENAMMGWTVIASVESQTRGTSPTSGPDFAENILTVSNKLGYFSKISQTSDTVIFNGFGNADYMGAQYGGDYSALFVTHSLVDKNYVDNAVAGGGGTSSTPNLTQVLAVGATSGTYIEFQRTKGIREIGGTGSYLIFLDTRTLWSTGDGYLNSSGINLYKDGHVSIQSSNGIDGCELNIHDTGTIYSSGFSQDGIQYANDYSPSYTDRSLVDKGYIDTRLAGLTGSGGATPSLADVLLVGNDASANIDMGGFIIQNVASIEASGSVYIETTNMINASMLTLMYNT